MSKAKMYGMKSPYIPNAKADMRHRKKVYQRGREKAFRCQYEIPEEKLAQQNERKKGAGHES